MPEQHQRPTPKGAATQSLIVDAASRAFASKGFAQTRMDDIVAEAGMTKGAVYFHFDSKADLARAVVESRKLSMLAMVRDRLRDAAAPQDRFDALVSTLADLIISDPASWSIVRLERELSESGDGGGWKKSVWDEWVGLVTEILHEGRTIGTFVFTSSAQELATVFVGAFDGVKTILESTGDNDPQSIRTHIALLAGLFDEALGR